MTTGVQGRAAITVIGDVATLRAPGWTAPTGLPITGRFRPEAFTSSDALLDHVTRWGRHIMHLDDRYTVTVTRAEDDAMHGRPAGAPADPALKPARFTLRWNVHE